jgi:hypothetical protein
VDRVRFCFAGKDAPVTVIWRAPYRHNLPVKHQLVSLENQLVRSSYQLNIITMIERFDDIGAEKVPCTSR